MRFGYLEVQLPGEEVQRRPLNAPTVSVGRSAGNRLVLDHDTIDRRHARITIQDGQCFVEDLGSTGGTFVEGERLPTGEARAIPASTIFWLGQVRIAWLADGASISPFAPLVSPATTPAASDVEPVAMRPVVPAQAQQAVTPPPQPGPRAPGATADSPALFVTVQPFRGMGSFTVEMLHNGAQPAVYQLSAGDPDESLNYRFEHRKVRLQPGQWAHIPLYVTGKDRLPGSVRKVLPFVVLATPLDAHGRPAQSEAELLIRPTLPVWWVPAAVGIFACMLLVGIFSYLQTCSGFTFNAPLCPGPQIVVFEAVPDTVTAGDTVALQWDVSRAHTVSVEPGLGDVQPLGILTLNPFDNAVYTLTATGGGGTVTAEVTISVVEATGPQVLVFEASPATLVEGRDTQFTLTWDVLDADTVRIEPLVGDFPASGNQIVAAPAETTTYILTATGPNGTTAQEVIVSVSAAVCTVLGSPDFTDQLPVHAGPNLAFDVIATALVTSEVAPVGRNNAGDWVQVQAAGVEGWVQADFVDCQVSPDTLPVVPGELLPTLAPTPTPTLPPAAPGEGFDATALISYLTESDGRLAYVVQRPDGDTTVLLADKDAIELLDYTPANGGTFALLALEGDAENLYLVRANGLPVGGGINPGWTTLTDADFSTDGQRLVVEAVATGTRYYVYDSQSGALLSEPRFPNP